MKNSDEKKLLKALEGGKMKLEKPSKKLLSRLANATENTFKEDNLTRVSQIITDKG